MAHKKITGVQQYATGTGTGALTLGAATSSLYRTMQAAGMADGDTMYARIQHATIPSEWEIVLVTYTASGTTIARSFDSKAVSATGAVISFTAGTKIVTEAKLGTGGWDTSGIDAKALHLDWFSEETNPLQSALDFLGADGGTIIVGNREYTIPTTATSAALLVSLKIVGEGAESALLFSGTGGGLVLTFKYHHVAFQGIGQFIAEDISFLTSNFASSAGLNGSGAGVTASWPESVGSTNPSVVFRNVKFGPKQKEPNAGPVYAWWDTALRLVHARNNSFEAVVVWGSNGLHKGIGFEFDGGTVDTALFGRTSFFELEKALYLRGVSEGVFIDQVLSVGGDTFLHADGNEVGNVYTTSTTSNSIGTGAKTFTVAHSTLVWQTGVYGSATTLYIRDAAAPTTNYMIATVTSYTGTTLVCNVTSVVGSGTKTSWTLSPEHYIVGLWISSTHGNNRVGQLWARWTAHGFWNNCEHQPYEAYGTSYRDMDFRNENQQWMIANCRFVDAGAASSRNGIIVRGTDPVAGGDARNFQFNFNHVVFGSRTTGIELEANVHSVEIAGIRSTGSVTNLIINGTAANSRTHVRSAWNDATWTSIYRDLVDGDTTPSVANDGRTLRTANTGATSITTFDDVSLGATFRVLFNDSNTTLVNSAGLLTKTFANYTAPAGTVSVFIRETDSVIREIARLSRDTTVRHLVADDAQITGAVTVALNTSSSTSDLVQSWVWTADQANWGLRLYQRHTGAAIYYDVKTRNSSSSDITALTFEADGSLVAGVGFESNSISLGFDSNGAISLGGVNKTPYIDFNSYNGTLNDYDVRLLVAGGTASTDGMGSFFITAGAVVLSGGLYGTEISTPAAPAANGYVVYAEDNGAGKTRLMVRFASGASQQLAIEP